MSTLLINTNGQSRFRAKTDLISGDTKLGEAVNGLTKNKIALSNTDNQPYLVPRGKVIDVVNNFSWYAGPKATSAALDKIPCVFLTEREQLLSSLISGALYYLNAAAGALDATGKSEFVQSILREFTGGTEFDIDLLKQHNLNSLQGIYFTTPTGFNYRLPIYGSPSTPTGEWSDGSSGSSQNTIAGMIDVAKDFIEEVATSVNFAQPGVYIEKPRYFDNVKGREESITFPLINTVRRGKQSPVQQNYELLWLLAFQNKPYKTSFARTPPPKIYSVYVPGQFAMPKS